MVEIDDVDDTSTGDENVLGSDSLWVEKSLPEVLVAKEDIEERLHDWMAEIRAHPGEPILVYSYSPESKYSIRVGFVRSDITDEEIDRISAFSLAGLDVTAGRIASIEEGAVVISNKFPIKLGPIQAEKSHQLYTSPFGKPSGEGEIREQFDVVIGNEAIANWFSDQTNTDNPYKYVLICRRLGHEVTITPQIARSVEERTAELIELAQSLVLEQPRDVEAIKKCLDELNELDVLAEYKYP